MRATSALYATWASHPAMSGGGPLYCFKAAGAHRGRSPGSALCGPWNGLTASCSRCLPIPGPPMPHVRPLGTRAVPCGGPAAAAPPVAPPPYVARRCLLPPLSPYPGTTAKGVRPAPGAATPSPGVRVPHTPVCAPRQFFVARMPVCRIVNCTGKPGHFRV